MRLLINNASRFAFDSLDDFSANEFDAHMAANVRAPILLAQALARAHGGGDALIVNILDAKLAAPNPDFLSYTLSKQALAGFTELAARALAEQRDKSERHRAGADAAFAGAERREFRSACMRATRLAAA